MSELINMIEEEIKVVHEPNILIKNNQVIFLKYWKFDKKLYNVPIKFTIKKRYHFG